MTILFQGDSITDGGRDRNESGSLGFGYAKLVGDELAKEGWTCFNRGISGNRVYDLESRWTEDCLDIKPDVLTILIGINDTWRRYDSGVPSAAPDFEASLDRICEQAVVGGAKLILLEPFVLPIPEDRAGWREDLDPRIDAVRRVARKHASALVPLDGLFAAAACKGSMEDLAADGVHPGEAGQRLIADALLAAIREVV